MASDPIIGYNVTEAVINRNEGKTKGDRKQLTNKVSKAFAITVTTAQNVVRLMQDSGSDRETGVACTGGKRVHLPANQVTTVYIRAHMGPHARGQNMLFSLDMLHPPPEGVIFNEVLVCVPGRKIPYIPVSITNTIDHMVYLDRHKVVGHMESVKTVYAATIQQKENERAPSKADNTEFKPKETPSTAQMVNKGDEIPKSWDPPVDLKHLTEPQQEAAKKVLREECQAFALYGDDVGCVPSLKMHITLHDTSPVQKTYMSVPKPLHNEVK